MKKITKILSLTVMVASMMTSLALLANSSNSVNVKQEVNEVGSDSTVELNNVNNDVVVDNQAIDVNRAIDNDEAVGDVISSNACTAEDSGQTTTTWMGVASGLINFEVSKDYVSESNVGKVKIVSVSTMAITSTKLIIPDYVLFNNNKYEIDGIIGSAFAHCTALTGTLTIPANVTTIGGSAFYGCTGLTSLDLTKSIGLTTIGSSAFNSCTGLTGTLSIPAGVTSIDRAAFELCSALSSLDLSKAINLQTIGADAFYHCTSLTGPLILPAKLAKIENDVFNNCPGLTGPLILPTSLTYIDQGVFNGCIGLTGHLIIPENVTFIGGYAFNDTNFQDFKFLSEISPTNLGTNIFGTNVTKTLWVPSDQTKTLYDPLAVSKFGLADASHIKVDRKPASVDINNLKKSYTINLENENKIFATAIANVQPFDATNKAVTWSLENAPTWLKIDTEGNIFANDGLKNESPGQFTFKVKVICQENAISKTTSDIKLYVTHKQNTDLFAWWWLLMAATGALIIVGIISISVVTIRNKKNK